VKDDVPARLAPGSFIVRRSATERLGPDYLQALVNGQVQHRAFGGILMGALLGGGLGYAVGGKKGAIGGAMLGGIGAGLYGMSGSTPYDPSQPFASSGATLSIGAKAAVGLGVAGGLGLLASGIGASNASQPISLAQVPAFRRQLEAEQASQFAQNAGRSAYLTINPQGGYSLAGFADQVPTRRWAEGGGVDIPMTSSSSAGNTVNVGIKVDISNNGSVTSSSNGQGEPFGQGSLSRFEKTVRNWVNDELVNQSRPDGFLSQKSRYTNRA
jgi:hypothetical protein